MSFKSLTLSAALSTVATLALAGAASAHMIIEDAYARASNKMAGAAFMEIINHSDVDDRLVDVRSDVAKRVQLHTHSEDENGVMKMMHVEEGFAISAKRDPSAETWRRPCDVHGADPRAEGRRYRQRHACVRERR